LRSYKIDPIVWGGDKGCSHEWGDVDGRKIVGGHSGGIATSGLGNAPRLSNGTGSNQINESQFCLHCSAWLGQLGLEPTIELYISHLVEVFGECKRVLKKTVTMWINIGDSYAGGGGGGYSDKSTLSGYTSENTKGRFMAIESSLCINKKNLPSKSLCQIPERLSIALTDQLGLIKRNTIVWWKRNCMPSSASDRFTVDFEFMYFFTKSGDYFFEQQFEPHNELSLQRWGKGGEDTGNTKFEKDKPLTAVGNLRNGSNPLHEQGRNKRTLWDIPTEASPETHFAVFPRALVYTPIKAGCPDAICNQCGKARMRIVDVKTLERYELPSDDPRYRPARYEVKYQQGMRYAERTDRGLTDCGCNAGFHPGVCLDPFAGTGTTCLEAKEQGKHYIGIELSPEYIKIAEKKLRQEVLQFNGGKEATVCL
jgi:site-specific DNA-methyltransferase (adenine-specific)